MCTEYRYKLQSTANPVYSNIKWFNLIIYVHWAEIFGDYIIERTHVCII